MIPGIRICDVYLTLDGFNKMERFKHEVEVHMSQLLVNDNLEHLEKD